MFPELRRGRDETYRRCELTTLTFDLLTLKLVGELHLKWGTFLPNLGTLGLWVLELFAMYRRRMDERTDKNNTYCPLPAAVRLECRRPFGFSARRSERIAPLLRELHWLRGPERVTFRLCVMAYRYLRGTAPAYLAESLHRTSNVDTRRRLRSADDTIR